MELDATKLARLAEAEGWEGVNRYVGGYVDVLRNEEAIAARGGLLEPTLSAARHYVAGAPDGEVCVLRTGTRPPESRPSGLAILMSLRWRSWFDPSEGLYLARSRGDLKFENACFLYAKKPNSQGAVPLGGGTEKAVSISLPGCLGAGRHRAAE
jgi:hypothetical protein